MLSSVTREGGSNGFEYYGTTGELQRVTLPYGGKLRWVYRDFTFSGNRTVREVLSRYLQQNAGGGETVHNVWHDDGTDAGLSYHSVSEIYSTVGQRVWYFNADHRLITFLERNAAGVRRRMTEYVWTWVNPATQTNPYVATTKTTLYGKTGSNLISSTEQWIDAYGNLKGTTEKDQNGNIVQTVGYYYLHEVSPNAAEYLSRYIRNRLTNVQVDGGGETYWPMSASYDTATITTVDLPPTIQLHDTANYPASMKYRGNATSVRKGNATTAINEIDVTGGVRWSVGPGGTMRILPQPPNPYPYLYGTVPSAVQLNGVQTSLTYDGMLHVSTSTGPEGVAAFTYDTLSRPTSRVLPDGSSARIEYSFSPAMTKEIVRNGWTKSYLDGLGRVVKTERGHGGVQLPPGQTMKPEVTESVTETEYAPCACSPFGKPWRTSRLHTAGCSDCVEHDELRRTGACDAGGACAGDGNGGEFGDDVV